MKFKVLRSLDNKHFPLYFINSIININGKTLKSYEHRLQTLSSALFMFWLYVMSESVSLRGILDHFINYNIKTNSSQICKMPFGATKDIQLSKFQVKILHHILSTNATLHKFRIKEHDHCHLGAEKQTMHTPICDLPQCSAVLDTFYRLVV